MIGKMCVFEAKKPEKCVISLYLARKTRELL